MIVIVLSGHAAKAGQLVTTPINSHAAEAAARRRNPLAGVGTTSLCMCGSWNLVAVERAEPEQRWQAPLRDSDISALVANSNRQHRTPRGRHLMLPSEWPMIRRASCGNCPTGRCS
jgi:hypothetical protein